jgi:hypothetical protein
VPTALAVFPQDFRTVRVFAERSNNITRYTRSSEQGGHFAYTSDTGLVVDDDVRALFGSL